MWQYNFCQKLRLSFLDTCCLTFCSNCYSFFSGITSRLEYLKELGVDATWLSPIFKSPMNDFGYDISDYYSIQPEYGTMEDFELLLKKARELSKYNITIHKIHCKSMHNPQTKLLKFWVTKFDSTADRLFELS